MSNFKFGDKVYRANSVAIWKVKEVKSCDNVFDNVSVLKFHSGNTEEFDSWCCHATKENYERLQQTFPNMKFEKPTDN